MASASGSALCAVLFLILSANPVQAQGDQGDVSGETPVPVGAGVSAANITRKNAAKISFHDFTLFLEGCDPNVKISSVVVGNDMAFGDWNVDRDFNGSSREVGENNNNTDPAHPKSQGGKLARVDRNPEDSTAIAPNAEFNIVVSFTTGTTGPCTLRLTPTDDEDNGISCIDLRQGNNAYVLNNPSTVFPGIGVASLNVTGDFVSTLTLSTNGSYHLDRILEIQSSSGAILQTRGCGGTTTCAIDLASRVAPNGLVRFDAFFDQLAPGGTTTLNVVPTVASSRPGLGLWAMISLTAMLIVMSLLLAIRRRTGSSFFS